MLIFLILPLAGSKGISGSRPPRAPRKKGPQILYGAIQPNSEQYFLSDLFVNIFYI